ncbi:MAG: hypothetical protein IKV62_06940 [Bacteroidales bacterium]|nr:hypothetical protein [Bacteroidales bacterium]
MKNKSYYLDLAERWFDALLTEDEERELKAFLAGTDDPDFDEVKAVAGFFAAGKAASTNKVSVDARRRFLPWAATIAIAASLAIFAAIGLANRQQDHCYILAYGEKTTDPELALESMENTLSSLFGTAPDVGTELEKLLK